MADYAGLGRGGLRGGGWVGVVGGGGGVGGLFVGVVGGGGGWGGGGGGGWCGVPHPQNHDNLLLASPPGANRTY